MRRLTETIRKKLTRRSHRYLAVGTIVVAMCSLLFYFTQVPPVLAQSSIGRLRELAAPASGQKILVFSPHPDDETIAAGGYITQGIKNGADIRIVLVTNGDKQHQKATRYAEFITATGILGVPQTNLIFLDFPDGELSSENETILSASLRVQIDRYNPDIIIFPHPRDYNHDHAVIGRVVESILKTETRQPAVYEYLVHYELVYPRPRKFDPNLSLLPPKRLTAFDKDWLRFPLSSDIEASKEKAIFTYQSQLHSVELNGLMHSFVRRNELFAIPKK